MRARTVDQPPGTVGTIHVRGRDLYVRQVGDGFPLLLMNGLGLPLEMWAHLEPHLPNSRLIEVDIPGSGRSAATRPPLTMYSYARMVRHLLDALEIPAADVLGLSFGGMIAQQLAIDSPRRVRKLVLASTSCGWGGVPSNPLLWSSIFLDGPNGSAQRADPGDLVDHGRRPRSTYTLLRQEFGVHGARLPNPRAYAHQILAASAWSSLPWLRGVEHEALVIGGSADALISPANTCLLTAWLPNARSHLVPSGGHLCILDRAAEVGPAIERFLSG